jgi:hypothetical protein
MKLKGLHFADVAEIQEAVTDELKKVQKEDFSAAFQKLYDRAKARIYASGAYFELKKGMCLPHVYSIFKKKSALKLLDRTVCVCVYVYGIVVFGSCHCLFLCLFVCFFVCLSMYHRKSL